MVSIQMQEQKHKLNLLIKRVFCDMLFLSLLKKYFSIGGKEGEYVWESERAGHNCFLN